MSCLELSCKIQTHISNCPLNLSTNGFSKSTCLQPITAPLPWTCCSQTQFMTTLLVQWARPKIGMSTMTHFFLTTQSSVRYIQDLTIFHHSSPLSQDNSPRCCLDVAIIFNWSPSFSSSLPWQLEWEEWGTTLNVKFRKYQNSVIKTNTF